MTQKNKSTQPEANDYRSASDKIRFTLTNNYMFKIIFQKTHILSGLLCALLGMDPWEIRSLVFHLPINYTFLLASVPFYCVVFGQRLRLILFSGL